MCVCVCVVVSLPLSGLSSKRYKGEVSLNSPRSRLQSPATVLLKCLFFSTLCVFVCVCLHTTGPDMQLYYVVT